MMVVSADIIDSGLIQNRDINDAMLVQKLDIAEFAY